MSAQSHTPRRMFGPPFGGRSTGTRRGRGWISGWSALVGALAIALVVVVALAIGDLTRGGPEPATSPAGGTSGSAAIPVRLPGGFEGMESEGVIHVNAGYSPPGIIGPVSLGSGEK
jgi:hypothetical protein